MKALIHAATWQEESPFQQWERCLCVVSIPRNNPKIFIFIPCGSVVVLPAFSAVVGGLILSLSLSPRTQTPSPHRGTGV